MGLRPCGLQVVVFSWSPQLLDLFTWSGSWTFLTSEAHPYPPQVRAKRTFLDRRPVRSRVVAKFEMADRRDWGGGGDDLEESTLRMIERIWESLTDIRRRMDQQAPVPPVAVPPGDGETVWRSFLSDIRVDANLCDLQNIGSPEGSFSTRILRLLRPTFTPLLPYCF
ncbi:hypothetical protein Taro_036094 [Colocasia esculenta]|uniref:Uncharacterized protein n=1 Tax=Colocasia esculenta TaxID=4460 RepID=A0A843VWE7_COLES|nr:hypothetical protein [Colocasia esculenta]